MKALVQLVIFMLVLSNPDAIISQITLNNSTFPEVGDTLYTVTTNQVTGIDTNEVGGEIVWDMSSLGGGIEQSVVYLDPSEGSSSELFQDANLLSLSNGQEIYYEANDSEILELGRAGLDPVLNAIQLSYYTEGMSFLRKAPISYQDNISENSAFFIQASASVVPDSILGPLAGSIDSLRLSVETEYDDSYDAYGTLILPDDSYEVLRMKRITTMDVSLAAKVPILGWIAVDATNPIFASLGDLLSLLGESVTTSYQFFGNNEEEVLATVSYDPDGNPLSTTYKGRFSTSTQQTLFDSPNFIAYPNPSFGNITFQVEGIPNEMYTVVIKDILGKKLMNFTINPYTGKADVELYNLRKGMYLYSIYDSKGTKLTTKRLLLLTP